MKNERLVEFLGWYGAVAILVGFFLVTFCYISPQSQIYLFLNLTGAFGICVEAMKKRALPSVFLNGVYFIVAFVAIVKYFL